MQVTTMVVSVFVTMFGYLRVTCERLWYIIYLTWLNELAFCRETIRPNTDTRVNEKSGSKNKTRNVWCTYCVNKTRITSFHQLKQGDHISFPGEHTCCNILNRLLHLYTHHAIVDKVALINGNPFRAIVHCFHFYSHPFNANVEKRETNIQLDLFVDEVCKEKSLYSGQNDKPEQIIKKAKEHITKKEKYNLLTKNCEMFAYECIAGVRASRQVRNARSVCLNIGYLCLITCCSWYIWHLLLLVFAICIFETKHLSWKYSDQRSICRSCFKLTMFKIWIKFVALVLTETTCLAITLEFCFAQATRKFGLIILPLLICFIIMLVPNVCQTIHSSFKGKSKRIHVSAVEKSDVIRLPQLNHDCIVYDKNWETESNQWKLTVIHYKVNFLSKSEVVKEEFRCNQFVTIRDFSIHTCFTSDVTLDKAESRLGEQRYNCISNRSSHLCFWTKVILDLPHHKNESVSISYSKELDGKDNINAKLLTKNNQRGRHPSTLKIKNINVWTVDDIREGEIIEVDGKVGVILTILRSEVKSKQCQLCVAKLNCTNEVTKCDFEVDMNTQNVKLHLYHPAHIASREEITRRAKSLSVKRCWFPSDKAFIMSIICERKDYIRITQFGDFEEGHVISFFRANGCIRHDAVVIEKHVSFFSGSKGRITLIHYDRKKIRQTDMDVDFDNNEIYLKTFEGYTPYPNHVSVDRAKNRLGERKYRLKGNRSSNFCYWVRVIQSPCVVRSTSGTDKNEEVLLIPDIGKACNKRYQMTEVFAIKELNAGSVIQFKNKRRYGFRNRSVYGIVTEVASAFDDIKVIYLKKTLFARGNVVEEWIQIDIKRSRVWVYRWYPERCYSSDEIVQNARKRLGERGRRMTFASVGFWYDAILRNKDDQTVYSEDCL